MMLVNVKLDISRCKRIMFQGCKLHWGISFLMGILAFLYCEEFVKNAIDSFVCLFFFALGA